MGVDAGVRRRTIGAVLALVAAVSSVGSGPALAAPPRSESPLVGDAPLGSIAGTVANRGTDEVRVFVMDSESFAIVASADVSGDGSYAIPQVPAGSYVVYFGASHRYWGPSSRSDEAWSNAHRIGTTTPVEVVDEPVTGIDATLEAVGRLVGRVVTSGGSGVGGALVQVTADGDVATQEFARYVFTDNSGNFSVPGLDVGSYSIAIDRDLDDQIDVASAGPVAVAAGATVDAGTFGVTVPASVPSRPASLAVSPGVGRAGIIYGLPTSTGASPLEYVHVTVWPGPADISFGGTGFDAAAAGLRNGVPHRVGVSWENGHGRGSARVADTTPTGCPYLWFTDVGAGSTFCDEIRWFVYKGISGGYPDGTFRPGDAVSRQAMAAFLYRLAGSPNGLHPMCSADLFDDVRVSHPFCGEIAWLVEEGITSGFPDGSFRPGDVVSRQAMAAFLYRYAGSPDGLDPTCSSSDFSDVLPSHTFCGEIAWLVEAGITAGYPDGTFRPMLAVSRQVMAAFLQRLEGADLAASGVVPPGGDGQVREGLLVPRLPAWSDPAPPPAPVTIRIPVP